MQLIIEKLSHKSCASMGAAPLSRLESALGHALEAAVGAVRFARQWELQHLLRRLGSALGDALEAAVGAAHSAAADASTSPEGLQPA